MMTVAVTGGIGSGKSTVCGILGRKGIPVYDADSAAKKLYVTDDTLLDSIEEAFGCGIRLPDGSLDREKLASIAFGSPDKLSTLEGIVHPAVFKDFKRWKTLQSVRLGDAGFCVIESAIILSKPQFLTLVDKVVLVDAPLPVRLRRACERDGVDAEKVIRRMAAQSFDLYKVDYFIRNEGSEEDLVREVEKLIKSLSL